MRENEKHELLSTKPGNRKMCKNKGYGPTPVRNPRSAQLPHDTNDTSQNIMYLSVHCAPLYREWKRPGSKTSLRRARMVPRPSEVPDPLNHHAHKWYVTKQNGLEWTLCSRRGSGNRLHRCAQGRSWIPGNTLYREWERPGPKTSIRRVPDGRNDREGSC